MGYMVSNLYGLGQGPRINHYLYITEPETLNNEARQWLNANFVRLGDEIGSSKALVRGYSSLVTEQIVMYLEKCLRPEKRHEVCEVFEHNVTIVATKNILPSTDSMVILPICKQDDGTEIIQKQIGDVVRAMRGGQAETLLNRSGNIYIEQSDFKLLLTARGARFVRAILSVLSIEIPFTPIKLKVDELGAKLLKRYPSERGTG